MLKKWLVSRFEDRYRIVMIQGHAMFIEWRQWWNPVWMKCFSDPVLCMEDAFKRIDWHKKRTFL